MTRRSFHNSETATVPSRLCFSKQRSRMWWVDEKSYGDDSNSGKKAFILGLDSLFFAPSNNSTVPDFLSRQRRSLVFSNNQDTNGTGARSRSLVEQVTNSQPTNNPVPFYFSQRPPPPSLPAAVIFSVAASFMPPCRAAVPVERRRSFAAMLLRALSVQATHSDGGQYPTH
jgi:hypothetical protein